MRLVLSEVKSVLNIFNYFFCFLADIKSHPQRQTKHYKYEHFMRIEKRKSLNSMTKGFRYFKSETGKVNPALMGLFGYGMIV